MLQSLLLFYFHILTDPRNIAGFPQRRQYYNLDTDSMVSLQRQTNNERISCQLRGHPSCSDVCRVYRLGHWIPELCFDSPSDGVLFSLGRQ